MMAKVTDLQPFLDSTEVAEDAEALRERMERDGYLFLRGQTDLDLLRQVRRDIISVLVQHEWLAPGTDPDDVLAGEFAALEGDDAFAVMYDDLQKLESFHAFAHDAGIVNVVRRVVGEDVLAHPRHIARVIFPSATRYTTPPHQDFVHIQGTPQVYTAWMPLDDTDEVLGGLAILAGSHQQGVYEVRRALGAGGLGVDTESLGLEWVGGDMRAGDLLLFHSLCVHRGRDNLSSNRIRLSLDYRYQGASQPLVASSLEPHHGRLTWEEVYAGWKSEQYQYYWKRFDLDMADFTRKWHESAGHTGPKKAY